jgi:prevent-host-death family protein
MIKTLRESKAKLSELVELASQGEDVLITVRGKVKARLVKAGAVGADARMDSWARRLTRLQDQYSTGNSNLSTEEILRLDREDRL